MNIKIKSLIIPLLLVFLLLATKLPFAVAGCFLLVIFAGISLKLFIKKAKNEYILTGIKSVPKELVFNSNTLSNKHCIVRYFPHNKIVVMDNPTSKENQTLRAFIVDKTNHESIDNCWREICSVYEEYTYLDTLFSFIDKASGRLNMLFLSPNESNFKIEGMEEFMPEKKVKPVPTQKINNELAKKIEQSAVQGQIVVEFNDLQKQKIKTSENKENAKDVVNMQDLTNSDKIDINLANAQTISELPGINIIMAKKIVEYRNLNGFFKNKEDFLNVSEVKSHFREKISSMITVEKSSTFLSQKEKEADSERIVD